MGESYQFVTVKLDDGTEGIYGGPAQLASGRLVVEVSVTPPREFPEGCSWSVIGEATKYLVDENEQQKSIGHFSDKEQ